MSEWVLHGIAHSETLLDNDTIRRKYAISVNTRPTDPPPRAAASMRRRPLFHRRWPQAGWQTSRGIALSNRVERLLCHYVTHTSRRTTTAGVRFRVIEPIAVVVRQLFTRPDPTKRIEPHLVSNDSTLTVWGTIVIDKASDIPRCPAVNRPRHSR